MQATGIGWTDFSDPINQLLDESGVGFVGQLTKKLFYVSVILAAITASASRNQVQPNRKPAFSNRHDVVDGVCAFLTISAATFPKLKQNGSNIRIDSSHASGASVNNALNSRPVILVACISLPLNRGVTWSASPVASISYSDPVSAFIAPVHPVYSFEFAFREGRARRSKIRKPASATDCFETVSARSVPRKGFNGKPVCTLTTPLQANAPSTQIFIDRKPDGRGGIF